MIGFFLLLILLMVLVAVCVMRQWGFDEMLVSESDILDGIAFSIAER